MSRTLNKQLETGKSWEQNKCTQPADTRVAPQPFVPILVRDVDSSRTLQKPQGDADDNKHDSSFKTYKSFFNA